MPGEDMGNLGLFDAAVHFLIVHARDAEDHIDTTVLQHMGNLRAKGSFVVLCHQALQNFSVNMTKTASSSSRPVSMAALRIHFAVSFRLP